MAFVLFWCFLSLSFGLLTGAMLLIGISIVGFWKSLTLATVAVSWRLRSKQRQWSMIAALCALLVMVSYPVFFAEANASFIGGGLSDSTGGALLDKWAVWHWGRTLLGLIGFVAATLALQSLATEHSH